MRPPASGPGAWKTLLAYNFMPTPTVLARREDVLAVGGFDECLRYGEDLDLWIRLARRGSVLALDEVLVRVREWSGSLTHREGHIEPDMVLPYVERYIEEERGQFAPGEVDAILGRRLHDAAVCLFYSGAPTASMRYFLRSLRLGFEPLLTLRYVPRVLASVLSGGRYPRRRPPSLTPPSRPELADGVTGAQ